MRLGILLGDRDVPMDGDAYPVVLMGGQSDETLIFDTFNPKPVPFDSSFVVK